MAKTVKYQTITYTLPWELEGGETFIPPPFGVGFVREQKDRAKGERIILNVTEVDFERPDGCIHCISKDGTRTILPAGSMIRVSPPSPYEEVPKILPKKVREMMHRVVDFWQRAYDHAKQTTPEYADRYAHLMDSLDDILSKTVRLKIATVGTQAMHDAIDKLEWVDPDADATSNTSCGCR